MSLLKLPNPHPPLACAIFDFIVSFTTIFHITYLEEIDRFRNIYHYFQCYFHRQIRSSAPLLLAHTNTTTEKAWSENLPLD